ncbi:hypothetical protein SS50377_28391 [Spironucleus salmonicida]|uniref:Uncharacterized protein n=1 Tax=Spironucleus salmonicida TaxID=348837 RepID=A0A9P8LK19_9EUKA|nr:hypothetical protein SS50377_28391 [Spironucleus salmonicida]
MSDQTLQELLLDKDVIQQNLYNITKSQLCCSDSSSLLSDDLNLDLNNVSLSVLEVNTDLSFDEFTNYITENFQVLNEHLKQFKLDNTTLQQTLFQVKKSIQRLRLERLNEINEVQALSKITRIQRENSIIAKKILFWEKVLRGEIVKVK